MVDIRALSILGVLVVTTSKMRISFAMKLPKSATQFLIAVPHDNEILRVVRFLG